MQINSVKDMDVFKYGYQLAMEIFELSKAWPKEERYSLTSQIRRSSRSVCSNLCEAWAKRRYEAHFISKLSDCDGENGETGIWLDFARDCTYMAANDHALLDQKSQRVGAMIGAMLKNPKPFLLKR